MNSTDGDTFQRETSGWHQGGKMQSAKTSSLSLRWCCLIATQQNLSWSRQQETRAEEAGMQGQKWTQSTSKGKLGMVVDKLQVQFERKEIWEKMLYLFIYSLFHCCSKGRLKQDGPEPEEAAQVNLQTLTHDHKLWVMALRSQTHRGEMSFHWRLIGLMLTTLERNSEQNCCSSEMKVGWGGSAID